ncbi:MAG: thermonuclease family protein [Nanoarchaeota archaeon]|nr:thermonuclease family protein [Nanoarchaeota archaeon]
MELKHLIIVILMISSGIFYYHITGYVVFETSGEIVARVIDGDTFELVNGQKVRLKGINTPEKSWPFSEEAEEFVRELVENKSVEIENYGFDKYGRILAHVFIDGRNLNREILENGFGTLYYYEEDSHYKELKRAEEFARLNEIGLWKKSSNADCLGIVEFKTDEPEKLVLENDCDWSLEIMYKDDATHIYEVEISANSIYTEEFSHIWNTEGDSIYVYDSEGLLIFYRYD